MARLYNLHARLLVLLFLGVVLDVGVFTTRVLAAPRLHGASGGLKVRKEIREMTCKEWDRFSSSVNEFRKSGKWDEFANLHTSPDVWDVAHSDNSGLQAAFLPWHRVYLSRMESELQKIDPEVTIPYWNWALDSENPLASPVLSDVFFGSTGNPEESYCVTDGSFKDDSNKTCIQRALPLDGGGFLTLANLKEVLTESSDYGRFVNRLENGFGLHGHLHMFLGGNMANLNSPKDPLFYAHHSFMDMLWWRWQKMHNSITSPAYKGDAEAPLYPFRESASEVFSSEEMGYTYSNPLKRDPKDNTSIPCFLEKGGRKDIVALGERVWTNLPNDVKALRQIPRRAPLPETRYWSQWLSLQEEQKGAISVEEIEAQISSLTDVIAQPSISWRVWRNDDGDFGLGMPLRMILDKSEEEEEKDPDTISEDKTCSAFPDCRNCFSSIKLAEEAGCVERYPESFRENLETAVTREFRKQAGEPPTKNEGVNAGPGIQENVVEGEGEMPASDVGIGESLDSTETTVPPLPSAPANVQPPPTSPPQTPPAPGPLPEDSQKDDTSMAETDLGTVEENIDSPLEEGSQAGEGLTEEEAQATSNVETLDKVVTMTVEALDEEKPVEQRVEDVFSDKVLGQVDALFEDVSSDSDSDVDSLEEEEKKEGKGKKKKKEEEEAAKEAVPSGVRMSPSAAKWENSCAKVYDQHRGYASEIFKASKLERLKLEKPIKKAVNQLSCSKQQIRFVGQQMIQHLSQQHTQGKHFYSYCLVRLGDLIAQQGPGLGASKQLAFAYAEVSCMVASAFKDFIYVLISSLQKACPLVVPKFPKGYRGLPNEIKGHVSLYAALCQLSPQQWFPFTEHAWSYLARFLNALPANEQTAIALDSFLQIAGHALFVAFRRQQVKVFRYVTDEFVAALKEGDDIDAVKSRLETYVKSELFRQEPEGSYIPETDDSQHIRC
mmetsp:Transcript_14102/g.27130  ORF Transcript_14102/g.27130 Transcript_14102/m.27130 type:complete len:947 (-) Transcript_14102:105-2945(-)